MPITPGCSKARAPIWCLTDPPWNVRIDGNVSGLGKVRHDEFAMASGEMSEAEFTDFLSIFLGCAKTHSRGGAILFVFMDWRHLFELTCAGREQGLALKEPDRVGKDNAGMGTFYRSSTSWCSCSRTATPPTTNSLSSASTARYRTNVWEYAGVNTFRAGAWTNWQCIRPSSPSPCWRTQSGMLPSAARIVARSVCRQRHTLIAATSSRAW